MVNKYRKAKPIQVILIGAVLLIIVYIITIGIYGIKFYKSSVSTNFVDWVNFSNYLTGILSPIFMAINIIVLVCIAVQVSNWEINKHSLDLKYKAIKEFINLYNELLSEIQKIELKNIKFGIGIVLYKQRFSGLVLMYKNLFIALNDIEKMIGIAEDIYQLGKYIVETIDKIKIEYKNDPNYKFEDNDDVYKEFEKRLKNIDDKYSMLLQEMQKEISHNINVPDGLDVR